MTGPEQNLSANREKGNWSNVFGYGFHTETQEPITVCTAVEGALGIPPDWVKIDIDDTTVAQGRYRHYKGGEYRVYGVGAREADQSERFVVYTASHILPEEAVFWLRPVEMFIEDVTVDGIVMPRFASIP